MDDETFHRIARALSEPHRVTILQQIHDSNRLNCGTLVERLPLAQATVSHHLKELAGAGLLEMTSEGHFNYYTFCQTMLDDFIAELHRRFPQCEK